MKLQKNRGKESNEGYSLFLKTFFELFSKKG